MYEKILVATDGSQDAFLAVRHAAELAGATGAAEVVVVHVCTACSADLDPDESNMETAKRIANEAGAIIKEAGVKVTKRVETEYPLESVGSAIIDAAEKEKADLIIMGSRGLSEFKGMLLGSVSGKVVQKSNCPVLVVKGGEAS